MMKRTLWYACLVLLCCSAGVLVLATSAGKTTLLPDSATSGKATPELAKLLSSHSGSQEAVAKQETAPVRSEAAQAPLLTEINPAYAEQAPADKEGAAEKTAEVTGDGKTATEKAVGKEASAEAEKINAEPAVNRPDDNVAERMRMQIRKDNETAARRAGHDATYVSNLSDADLHSLVTGEKEPPVIFEAETPKTNETPNPEETPEVKSSETSALPVEFSPVALDTREENRPTSGAASSLDAGTDNSGSETANPVVKAAEVAAHETVTEPAGTTEEPVIPMVFETTETAEIIETPVIPYALEEVVEAQVDPETELKQALEADQTGQPLTSRQKTLIRQYDAAHPRTDAGSRSRDQLDDNGGTTFVYTGDSLKIPPSGSGGSGTDTTLCSITVSGLASALTDVEVEIDSLMHTYDGDLHIYLQGPTGLRVLLSNDNGGSGENYLHTRFSDAATTLITAGTYPYTGSFKPEEALSAYDGTDPNGIWTLRINDDAGGDSGAVFSWRIQVKTPNTTAADNFATTAISGPNTEPYSASASATVTATFINYGTTTQTCPVKYSFNGGATVEETSASLVQFATDVHSFATNITLPTDTGNYILTVWTDHATDADRTDDTLRMAVRVFNGGACQSAITIAAVAGTPDSASYNNCGAGSNNPGQPCGTAGANAGSDMVFKMDVADGQQGEIWQSSNAFDSRHSLRWNGACPGTNVIDCQDSPDEKKLRFVNHTGSTQTIYFTVSYYGSALTCGNFMLAWHLQNTSDATLPYANGFEVTPPSTGFNHVLPDFWSIENSNNDMYPWVNSTTTPFSGGFCAYKGTSTSAGNDDWLFTPGLPLTAGVSYGLQYYRKAYSTTYPESLEVKIGTQNLSSAMTSTIAAFDSFKTNVWTKKNYSFSVSSTGTYYIGFHSYTRTSSGGCYLDSVRVEANPAYDFTNTQVLGPIAGPYNPSASLPVSGRFQNIGQNAAVTEVAYTFNGGAVVAENTASLNPMAYEDHTFATNLTTPAGNGTYVLTMYSNYATDGNRANDTLRRNIVVFPGGSCDATISPTVVLGTADSLTYNNTGAVDNTPGQSCGASGQDMVFKMDVADGQQGEFWQSSNAITSRHTMRWGSTCPGLNLIDCSTVEAKKMRYVNHTGSTQTIYITVGNSTAPGTGGNIKLAWHLQTVSDATIPFIASFEVTPTPSYHVLPNFWSIENSNADAYVWENYNVGAMSGTYCARKPASTSAGSDDWLFTPGLPLNNGTTYYFEFYRKGISTTYPESLEVKIGNQNASSAMTTSLMAFDSFKTNVWVPKFTTFTVPSTGTYYIGFHSYTRNSSGGCYIDSVRVLEGLCSSPTLTANPAETVNYVTLTSTVASGHGGPVEYQWFTGEGCQEVNRIAGARSSSYVTYTSGTFSLRAWRADSVNCAACDSALATVLADTCSAVNVPVRMNFESGGSTFPYDCWTQENTDGLTPTWGISTTNPLRDLRDAYIIGSTAGNNDWLFSKPINLTGGTTYTLEYFRRSYSATYYDSLEVKYGTVRHSGAMTTTIFPADTCQSTTVYIQKDATFVPPSTGVYYIGFHSLSKSASAGTRIDSVSVLEGACSAPVVAVDAAAVPNYVTLTANVSGGFGGVAEYQWFTGTGCEELNRIVDARSSSYLTFTSGVFSVRAWRGDSVNCAACDSAEATVLADTCVADVEETAENFEDTADNVLPWDCWTQSNVNGDATNWALSTTTPYAGTKSAYIAGTTAGNDDWLLSKPVSLTSGITYVVEYMRRSTSTTYYDSLEIKCGTVRHPTYMTTPVAAADTFKTNVWTQKTILFTPASSATYYFGWHSLTKSTSAGTYIDSVHIYAYGPCSAPTVTVNPISSDLSATLVANIVGGHGGPRTIQWFTGELCAAGNEISGATSTSYTTYVPGVYSCQVHFGPLDSTACSGCDSAIVSLSCATPVVPAYIQNFDGVTAPALPACWSQEDVGSDGFYWQTYNSSTYAHSGTNSVRLTYSTTNPKNDWLISPAISLSADTTYTIEYWYRIYATSDPESMEVMIGTARSSAAMTTTLKAGFRMDSTTYQQDLLTFTPPSTGTYYIGWHGISVANMYYLHMDDIRVYAQNSCIAPDSVVISGGTEAADSLWLTATPYGGWGGTVAYQWYTGADCQTGSEIVGATAKKYKVTTSGAYSVKASYGSCGTCRSTTINIVDCAGGWTGAYTQGFESTTGTALPVCWTQEDADAYGVIWGTSTTHPHTGLRTARISYNSSAPLNDWLYSVKLNLHADTTYNIDYWYAAGSMSWLPERLEVLAGRVAVHDSMLYTVTAAFDINDTTWVQTNGTFRPPVTGQYYIGWHAISITNRLAITVDDIAIYASGGCTAPDSVKINNAVGADSARLKATVYGGTGGPAVYQWYTGSTCDPAEIITGATAETLWVATSGTYSCQVYRFDPINCAVCASGSATVYDCDVPRIGGFTESVDLVTPPVLPPCWNVEDYNGEGTWVSYYSTTYTRSRPNAFRIYYDYDLPHDDWLIAPAWYLSSDTTYIIDYWYRSQGSDVESLAVAIGTSPTSTAMTTILHPTFGFTSTTYLRDVLTFQPSVSDTYYVGWHALSPANMYGIYLDDIKFYNNTICQAPDSVRANAVSGYIYSKLTANVYGGLGSGPTYQWYTGESCQAGNEIVGATAADYYATASGTYSVYAMFNSDPGCAACDSALATVRADSCGPVSITPFTQDFETLTTPALPTCWTKQNVNNDSYQWNTTTTWSHSPTKSVYIYYTSSGNNDWLYTPAMNLTAGTEYALQYWRRAYYNYGQDSLEIKYGTIPVDFAMTNVIAAVDTCKSTAFILKSATFTPATSGTYYVGFHSLNKVSSSYTYIDDVMLFPTSSCSAPTVSVADCTNYESVTMAAVTSGGYGSPVVYQWYTGSACNPANAIPGANQATYTTTVSGDFACRVYFRDSTSCSGCDFGSATVNTPPDGYSCSVPIFLTGVDDSAQWNNCGMGDNNPGQSCGNSRNDMVFACVVPHLYKCTIGQYYNNFDSRHSMRLSCSDYSSDVIGCIDDPDYTFYSYSNCTGAADTVYFIVGYYSTSNICGDFKLQWKVEVDTTLTFCPDVTCTPTVTESEPNGGCSVDSTFDAMVCGDVISGSAFATASLRDVDAYEMTIAEPKNLIVSLASEFNGIVYLYTDTVGTGCADVYRDTLNFAAKCSTEVDTFWNVPAGIVHLYVTLPFQQTCGVQNYCLTVNCEPGTPKPGDNCETAFTLVPPAVGTPTTVVGTTVRFIRDVLDSCGAAPSQGADVFYKMTLTSCTRITMSLDSVNGSTTGDKFLSVFEETQCGVNSFLCNDDWSAFDSIYWQPAGQYPGLSTGSFVGGEMPAGVYYIRVGTWATTAGPYRLTVYNNGACPACNITCNAGDDLEVAEVRYDQTFNTTDPNGGCLNTTPVFDTAVCGDTICGYGFTYQTRRTAGEFRDTDWYLFTTTEDRVLSLWIDPMFPAIIGLLDTNSCVSPTVMFYDSNVVACTPTVVTCDTLPAGTYALFVAPKYATGNPLPSHYRLAVTCNCIMYEVEDVTVTLGTYGGAGTLNDIRIRWTADSSFAGIGTYKVYWNLNDVGFPGAGWNVLQSGVTPVLGPDATYVDDLDIIGGGALPVRRYYLVTANCE